MRKQAGFQAWKVPVGILLVREEEDGRWVVLAGDPHVKIDNKHLDGRPHMHVGSWESQDRRALRPGVTVGDVASAIRSQLAETGRVDVEALEEALA